MKSLLLANIHDSLLTELYVKEIDEACEIIKYNMVFPYYENVGGNQIRLEVDEQIGDVWGFGKSMKYWKSHPEEWAQLLSSIDERNSKLYI
jgi:hypothetical protein